MRKRGARSKPSPEPYVPIPDVEPDTGACILCADPCDPWPAEWCEVITRSDRMTGFAHVRCIGEYRMSAAQMPFAAALQTPLF